MIPFNRHVPRDRQWVSGCQGVGRGMRVNAKGDGASFGVMKIFWNWIVVMLV